MVKRIIWPFHIGDFMRDTLRCKPLQKWAYISLCMEYWVHGGLPDDDESLRQITGLDAKQWRRAKPKLQTFFHSGWKHKRLDLDIEKAAAFQAKQIANSKLRWSKSAVSGESKKRPSKSVISGNFNNLQIPTDIPNACLPYSYNKDKSLLDPTASAGSLATAPPTGALARQPGRRSQNKFTDCWQADLAKQYPNPGEFSRALDVLAANPEVWDRITSAEMSEKGSGAKAAMKELLKHVAAT